MIAYNDYAKNRDAKKLTDGKVAELAGFGRSTFSDWKSGRSCPKFKKMHKIAEVLGIDYLELVSGNDEKFSSLNPKKNFCIRTTGESISELSTNEGVEDAEKSIKSIIHSLAKVSGLSKTSERKHRKYVELLSLKEQKDTVTKKATKKEK